MRSRAGTKKIDTWEIRHEGRKCGIDVYMRRNEERSGYFSVSFRAECKELLVDESDKDLEALRTKAMKAAKAAMSENWENWLRIKVSRPSRDELEERHIAVSIDVECIGRVGIGTPEERYMEMNEDGSRKNYSHVTKGVPEVGWADSSWRNSDTKSERTVLVRDTPEMRAAINEIKKGFLALYDKFTALFDPKTAEKNLLRISALSPLALPAKIKAK